MSAASAPSRHGLAPINAPDNALILSSATPGKVVDDSKGQHSVLVAELLNNLNCAGPAPRAVFNKTRVAISRASEGEQVPSVSSSLLEDVHFGEQPAASRKLQGRAKAQSAVPIISPRFRQKTWARFA